MPTPRPIIDAHLDLAWSALYFNRDLTWEVDDVRRHESGMTDERARGRNTVTFPELRRAGIQLCVATLLARGGPEQTRPPGYKRTDLDYINQTHAHAIAHGQLAYYRQLEKQGVVRFIKSREDLENHWKCVVAASHADHSLGVVERVMEFEEEFELSIPDAEAEKIQTIEQAIDYLRAHTPLGIILSMEGADPIVSPAQVQAWWDLGLRAVGPAHYGRSHYAYGTGVSGPLSPAGRELLKEFDRVGMILDVTHLCDQSMAEALDLFTGRVLASHHNCRAIIPGDRQLTDEQIKRLIDRDAVIGAALDAWMLYPNWIRGETKPAVVGLSAVVDHIDHICQLAGGVKHCAIGSDLDGGFGIEQTPHDLNTIADLQKLAGLLTMRGYSEADIDLIFHGNWLRFFGEALPRA